MVEFSQREANTMHSLLKDVVSDDEKILRGILNGDYDKNVVTETENEEVDKYTLSRQKWNLKTPIRFLSVRAWRKEKLRIGINWITEHKRNNMIDDIVAIASREIFECLIFTFGRIDFSTITAPPSSGMNRRHLATEISQSVSKKTGIPFNPIFKRDQAKKYHHPKQVLQEDISLIDGVLTEDRILILDDIATGGTTLKQCIALLPNTHYLACAWIYGYGQGK